MLARSFSNTTIIRLSKSLIFSSPFNQKSLCIFSSHFNKISTNLFYNLNYLDLKSSKFANSLNSVIYYNREDIVYSGKTFAQGMVFTNQTMKCTVKSCNFLSLISNNSGGAITVFNSMRFGVDLVINLCLFQSCMTTGISGAIYFIGSEALITKSCFYGCSGPVCSSVSCSVRLYHANDLNSSTISKSPCLPSFGTAIDLIDGYVSVSQTNCSSNHASSDFEVSGLSIVSSSNIVLQNSVIENCSSSCSFSIQGKAPIRTVYFNNIISNTVDDDNALISFDNELVISNCVFANNNFKHLFFIRNPSSTLPEILSLIDCQIDMKYPGTTFGFIADSKQFTKYSKTHDLEFLNSNICVGNTESVIGSIFIRLLVIVFVLLCCYGGYVVWNQKLYKRFHFLGIKSEYERGLEDVAVERNE